ncbi:MAG: RsmD family RNA methyltransferase, partial [Microthrixaceae bacterium]
ANLERTHLADSATVQRIDASAHLATTPGKYDIVLADPPYAFDGWVDLLESIDAPMAVLESAREPDLPTRWDVVRQKRYGTTVVTIVAAN